MKNSIVLLLLLLPFAIGSGAFADDSGDDYGDSANKANASEIESRMQKARSLIGKTQYKQAIRELNKVVRNDWQNADAWNLLGYSNRKLGKFKKAGKAYRKALKFNPRHKGALEYQGELFISLKAYDKARKNRDRLAELCPSGCDELSDLEQALAAIQ